MKICIIFLFFSTIMLRAGAAEETNLTLQKLGLMTGKQFFEIKTIIGPLILESKEYIAKNSSQKFENVTISEIWKYTIKNSSLSLIFEKRQFNKRWEAALPSVAPDDFTLKRLAWRNFNARPDEIGKWPFRLSAHSTPEEVIKSMRRPEINTLDASGSGRLTFSSWSFPGLPFELTFRNNKIEEIAVIDSSKPDHWTEYFK